MLVKVRQFQNAISVSRLVDNQLYCYETDYKLNSVRTWVYDVVLGTWNSVEHRYFDEQPRIEVPNVDTWISSESEAKTLSTLLQGELSADQLTQELTKLGFERKKILRYHSGGYALEDGITWSMYFLEENERMHAEIGTLIEESLGTLGISKA